MYFSKWMKFTFFVTFLLVISCQKKSLPEVVPLPLSQNGVLTNVYQDQTKWLTLSNLESLSKKMTNLSVNDQGKIEKLVRGYFKNFNTFGDIENGYWAYLSLKYFEQTLPLEPTNEVLLTLSENGVIRILGELVVEELPKVTKTHRTEVQAMLAGVKQYGIDQATEEKAETQLDQLYWSNEKLSIKALLQTNEFNQYFLSDFKELKKKAGQLPLGSISKLYVYEQGGKTYDSFIYQRRTNLQALRASFPVKDRWIFTNYNWPSPGETPR